MKNSIIITLSIIGVLILAAIGYAFWGMSNVPQTVENNNQNNPTTTTTPTENSNPNPGAPVVQTDSTSAPYISTVVVKGSVNPNGAATTYWYEYGKTSDLGSKTANYVIGSGYTNIYTPAYIIGLSANTNYYFRLVAQNSYGTVNGQTYSFTTNNTPAPTGTAPTTSTSAATSITKTTANLNGKINPNGTDTTYWFEYGTTAELGSVTDFQSAGNSKTASSVAVSVSNLKPATKYYFRLNAQNQFGTINGQILNFTTQGPAEPSAPTVSTTSATAIASTSAKLGGSVQTNGAVTTYWFEYSTSPSISAGLLSTPQLVLTDSATAVNLTTDLIGLKSNTKYYFRITAQNQYGTVRGSTMSFTTQK